ncbi:MAG: hypothetical protein ACKOB4_05270 [Acidobacteriota bacterium]
MLDVTIETTEEQGVGGRMKVAEEKIAQAGENIDRLRKKVTHAVEDKYDDARRAIRRGRHAAEDMVDEASYRIKRDPLNAVAITFGVGLGMGVLIGWFLKRDRE